MADGSEHSVVIRWSGDADAVRRGKYSRAHTWTFDGGATVHASSSPHVVPLPYSDLAGVDPEEAYVASISSCHMLWFLSIAVKHGCIVTRYEDQAVGVMRRDTHGKSWVSAVTLHPVITYAPGTEPSPEREAELHHEAHEECFIANSVRTVITVAPSVHSKPA